MRFSFRLKIALLTATVSAVPLVIAGWQLIDVNAREVESATQSLQLALVAQVAELADAELARAEGTLTAIATTLADAELAEDARLAASLRLLDADPSIDVVAVYDADGALIDRMHDPRVVAATPDALDDATRARADEAGRAVGEAVADGPVVRVLLVVPVRADGRVTGYAAAPWSLAAIQTRVADVSTAQLASREGVLVLADERGRALADPEPARLLADVPGAGAEATRAPVSEEREADGRTWLDTRVGLRALPWSAVASIPADVAYASLAQMRQIVGATIAGTLLVAVLAAFLFARWLAAPIVRLVDLTKEIAARRFDARVTIETGDELATLGGALNDAAAELERSEARVREEIAIRADLGRYLPAELVEQIVEREQSMELGGQRRAITVLFADVVAFTPLSDRLAPEVVVAILNELFTLLTEAVFRHGGTVDKFVGDCVMAVFGAPAEQPDHAARALATARDMLRFLEAANAGLEDRYGVTVQLAIGVNSGDAVVGNVGSEKRMEYTAIGDVVNVAARLETIARPQQILVTRATADAAGDEFERTRIGEREVPGRAAPVELFEVSW
ncbi:MAG: HAMP domain-containing protein [Sandaracinaceae bacterium]|nr:HAMP domain-containing protein [Sandaracinaceae bacterium]